MNPFEHAFPVEASDIDALGHVNNIAYVRWIQEIAVAHSASVGLDYDAYRAAGAIFVVRRHEVDYLKPVGAGEALIARTWITDVAGAKCHRHTEIRRAQGDAPIARGLTTWVLVDIATGRPKRIPTTMMAAFGMA